MYQALSALMFSKVHRLVSTILCSWLAWVSIAPAQHLERLTVDDGLSQGFVHSVVQTRDGFLWVATLDGLNRYDGTGFKVYRNDPADPYSINSDFVLELMEDSRGILWVITDQGPNLFDSSSGRFYHPKVVRQFSLNNINPLRCFHEDRFGRIWAIFENEIVQFVVPDRRTPERLTDSVKVRTNFFPKGQIGIVHNLSPLDSAVWIIAEKGNFSLSYAEESLRPLSVSLPAGLTYVWPDTISKAIWLQHSTGISRLSEGKLSNFTAEGYEVGRTQGWSGPTGTYFFSQTKIYRWQNGVLTTLPGTVPEWIMSACEDRNGILWLGTNAHGLCKVLTGRTRFGIYCEGNSCARAPVEDDQGNLWVHSSQEEIGRYYRFDPVSGQLKEPLYQQQQNFLVNSRSGGFWFLSDTGTLCHMDHPGGNILRYYNEALGEVNSYYLLEDHQGRLGYVTSDAKMDFFDPRTSKWSVWSYDQLFGPGQFPSVSAFVEDASGHFWIGTSNGLIEALPEQNGETYRFKYYGSEAGLSRQRILSLSTDPSNPQRLWIGTQHGLNWMDLSTGKIETLGLRDGLPNDVIYSILPANDSILWIGTNAGLLRVNHLSRRWQHFTKNDGLPGSEFNTGVALRLRDGRMIFGGVNGLVLFHPDKIAVSTIQPGIAITEMLVNSKPYQGLIDPAIPIRLSADQNYVSFRFALLDYVNPASNRYQYRLIGANANWTPLGSDNSITFSNLRPGHYQLEVRGVNSEGAESKIARLSFVILPPWWRSIWAFIGYGLVFFLSAWLLFQWRRRQVRFRKRLAEEHREAERLKELDRFKSRLYANITHEFRTPLTVILGVAEQLEKGRGEEEVERLRLITRNGEQLLRLVNQMLDWSKLENSQLQLNVQRFDVIPFLQVAAEPFAVLAAAKNVLLENQFPDGTLWIDADPDRLNDIVANLLSNAVKFTPAKGKITLSVQVEQEKVLCIAVEDNGIGITAEHLPYIFDRFYQIAAPESGTGGTGIGLSYAQELAHLMGGSLTAGSIPGEGTKISLLLPQPAPMTLVKRLDLVGDLSVSARIRTPGLAFGQEDTDRPVVLLIEDNPDVARYTADCLSGRFVVHHADNGAKGVKKALEIIPDLVISDVMMPVMDGFGVCSALKQDLRTSHIPIVLLTARADDDSRLQGLQYGAEVYLAKPFKKDELLLKLDNLLRLRAAIQARHSASFRSGVQVRDETTVAPPPLVQDDFIRQVLDLISQHFADPDFNANSLHRALHMSSSHLHRKLAALTGNTPGHLLRLHRLEQSRRLLLSSRNQTVAEIAYQVGYRDANYFNRAFAQEYGMSPGVYRKSQG